MFGCFAKIGANSNACPKRHLAMEFTPFQLAKIAIFFQNMKYFAQKELFCSNIIAVLSHNPSFIVTFAHEN